VLVFFCVYNSCPSGKNVDVIEAKVTNLTQRSEEPAGKHPFFGTEPKDVTNHKM
jgi:hypothetical protein